MGSSARWSGALPDAFCCCASGASCDAAPSKRVCWARALCATNCSRCNCSMRFCSSLILVSLTSSGAASGLAGERSFAGVAGFLPPVSHMIATIRNASPMSNQDCTFFGRRPGGLGAFSCTSTGWLIVHPSVRGRVPRKRKFFLTDRKVARVDDFRRDVHAVLKLEREQVRFAILDFIQSGFFARGAPDVCEGIVMVDGGN